MGQDYSSSMVEGTQSFKTSHPNCQDALIVTQGGQKYIQNSLRMPKSHYDSWKSSLGKVAGRQHSSFMYLPTYTGFVEKDTGCGGSDQPGHVVANYPNYPHVLSDVIADRRARNQPFKEKQLYYLLYSMTSTKRDAYLYEEPLGDIRPQNIFIDDREQIKMGSLYSFPNEKTGYEKFINKSSPDYHVYLAPQDLRLASQGRLDNRDNDKSEIFAMGITTMGAGLLDDMSSLYDYPSRQFNYAAHSQRTNRWLEQPQYSEIFKSIVLNMCHPSPDKRMSLEEIWGFLHQYEFNIINKQQFLVTNPPNRLEEGVSTVRSTILRSKMK